MLNKIHRIVITGGPGSGKTTLINALGQKGFPVSAEAGRAIIKDQLLIGGTALPWLDRNAFAELMLSWELRSWHSGSIHDGVFFYDRGIVDVAGYLEHCQLPIPKHLVKAIELFRYADTVFIAPPWEEIFTQDHERKQSFTEALLTYNAMLKVYQQYGYQLIELPFLKVEERLEFIVSHL